MKYLIFFFLNIITISGLNAQNCKYKTNDLDKFTKKYTKITKPERVIGSFYTAGEFSVKKTDTSYFFIFDYVLSSYSNFKPYKINKGSSLMFLLENGETITINSADDISGIKKTTIGIPPVYNCYLTNVSYPISRNQIDLLFSSKIKTIRFYRTESNGKEDFIDNEIKNKNQDDIQNLIKCVL